ncbi:hypothetical protein DOTSEDRAFT_29319 [Dothistroma septosporum NZE10]|uniref:Uncharacterized protein n=1 Tax=Dothistroma septosporum (strain NZE10 / CBS 128990) TaxID=675120 RepID=N1PBG2_DOTSN|nr:hypothetical protein DOTSEDRAFT_29319 [Dothistroma septosporum NZE10]
MKASLVEPGQVRDQIQEVQVAFCAGCGLPVVSIQEDDGSMTVDAIDCGEAQCLEQQLDYVKSRIAESERVLQWLTRSSMEDAMAVLRFMRSTAGTKGDGR